MVEVNPQWNATFKPTEEALKRCEEQFNPLKAKDRQLTAEQAVQGSVD